MKCEFGQCSLDALNGRNVCIYHSYTDLGGHAITDLIKEVESLREALKSISKSCPLPLCDCDKGEPTRELYKRVHREKLDKKK